MDEQGLKDVVRVLEITLGLPAASITNLMIHLEVPMGTMVVHTFPTDHHYKAFLHDLISQTPEYIDITEGMLVARIIPCDRHETAAAVLVISNQDNGEIAGVCVACMCDFAQAWLQQFAPDRLAPPPAPLPRPQPKKAAATVANDGKGGESVAGRGQESARTT